MEKTRVAAEKAVRLALDNAGCTGLIAAPTNDKLKDAVLPAFREACDPGLIHAEDRSRRMIVSTPRKP